ncbi:MAG: AAA family ATPase [Chloroflexi bacterium]|nr:AAA family ATPase [Chloroflexota bacterium]
MYKSFRVKNFRCFKDLQINDLGRVNLIAGKNNTGKTALMEAMYILSGNREAKTLIRRNLRTIYRLSWDSDQQDSPDFASDIISWTIMFRNHESKNEIALDALLTEPLLPLFPESNALSLKIRKMPNDSADFDDTLYKFRIGDFASFGHSELLEFESEHNSRKEHLLLVDGNVVGLRSSSNTDIVAEFLSAGEKQGARISAKRFSDLRRRGDTSILCDTLIVIDPRLKGVELLYDGYRTLMFADLGLDQLKPLLEPLTSLGEGIQRVASLTLAMTDHSIRMVFIDEIEHGLHHSVQCQVWKAIGKLARELNIQVFATTHSLEMIRAAYEAFSSDGKLDEFRYHRLDRDAETDDIEAVTYNELDLNAVAAFDFDFEVRG